MEQKSNNASHGLGIVSIVLGIIALVFSWIPILGIGAIPLSLLGGLLAIIGLVISKGKSKGLPIAGLISCIVAFFIQSFVTASTAKDMKKIIEGKPLTTITVTKDVSQNNTKKEYIKNFLTLSNIESKKGYGQFDVPNYSDQKDTISGTLKNIGERTLNSVEITIYFLDSNGKRVGEKTYSIVNVNGIMGETSPLKPNYTKDFGYVVSGDAPSDWNKKCEVEITNIDFAS